MADKKSEQTFRNKQVLNGSFQGSSHARLPIAIA
jgi:hypothetical protein